MAQACDSPPPDRVIRNLSSSRQVSPSPTIRYPSPSVSQVAIPPKKLQVEVDNLNEQLVGVNESANNETEKLQTLFGEVKIVEKEHEDIIASIEEAKGYERKKRGYELYLDENPTFDDQEQWPAMAARYVI